MCENLYGVFAFILLDTVQKKVYCGRDTYGVRPAFKMLTQSGTLAVCSEAKGLLNLKLNDLENPKIEAVLPGTFEEYSLDINPRTKDYQVIPVRTKKFHVIGSLPKYDVAVQLGEDVYENIRSCITNAVRMRLMSHRRIGCLLSGGLDSSLITGLMVQEARKAGIKYPIQTFSIGMDEHSPDVIAARKVYVFSFFFLCVSKKGSRMDLDFLFF